VTRSLVSLPEPEAHLSVRGLSVMPSGEKAPILRNISFEVGPGQALGVIGRSGSGKSTLARALVGYWAPFSGEIRLGARRSTSTILSDWGDTSGISLRR
jgi:ABC-type protease/lipase transport system fused ATPase/permease subunit